MRWLILMCLGFATAVKVQKIKQRISDNDPVILHLSNNIKPDAKILIHTVFTDTNWCALYIGTKEKHSASIVLEQNQKKVTTGTRWDNQDQNVVKRPMPTFREGQEIKFEIVFEKHKVYFTLNDEYTYDHEYAVTNPFKADSIEVHNFKDVSVILAEPGYEVIKNDKLTGDAYDPNIQPDEPKDEPNSAPFYSNEIVDAKINIVPSNDDGNAGIMNTSKRQVKTRICILYYQSEYCVEKEPGSEPSFLEQKKGNKKIWF